jgi:PIN domain nuclease of toxin-antitoxin system
MSILLDTNALIWWFTEPTKLSAVAREVIERDDSRVCISAAAVWEIAIKVQLGKLRMPAPVGTYLPAKLATEGIEVLPITLTHALQLLELPLHHRDPFDRIMIAQCQTDQLSVVTADRLFATYGVTVIW